MFIYLAFCLSGLKKSYDKANAKFRSIPPGFGMKMLSPYDYNPWLVPNGTVHLKKACCHNSHNSKVHDPFLLSRLAAKNNLDQNIGFLSSFVNEAGKKRFIMSIDLKPIVQESVGHNLSFNELKIFKQSSAKQSSHTTNVPTLDDDPKDFYVKVVDFSERSQNITVLYKCKKMIERVFYPILSTNAKYMYKSQSPTFDQHFVISGYREAFSSFNFTELLYNPIEQAQRGDATRGCEFINKNNTQLDFNLAINSMNDG
ncbi:hypothetical protein AX774_g2342 [Zancudomyces culisetae]|uniref:Uncharacterized protein n=1 Tax=Zancudomyces culisetae TaxID=1213189 RepID=A0A1R1PT60_ZANCU|nr:hypothetical protein AX774_g2342 [Zancudomyces culisetae]|eukprot:OMH84141.1 hypothetical protein AX774_g2342 [Zancudomyces culisetae]